jgi:uncharacterized protein YjcR
MNENKNNWNAHEFRVYLMLFAANADFELTLEEKELIVSKASKAEYLHIHKVFEKDNDYERINCILSFREQYFSSEKAVEKLTKEIYELLEADGKSNVNEKNLMMGLTKLLKN